MGIGKSIGNWLENRWVTPAYAGWLLGGLTVFFFGAATNTMVGWLYVISGISTALLGLAAVGPPRSLRDITLRRRPIVPVSAGDRLTVEIEVTNQSTQPKTLLQLRDILPFVLGKPVETAIEVIPPGKVYKWVYYHPTEKRGLYRWHQIQLRTAMPLGLFWCSRRREAKAGAIVYPQVLPLGICPLVDEMGQKDALMRSDRQNVQNATEGLTRALRPYRMGDPFRLIHWRTSARHGELLVRELEVMMGGQEVVISLDSALTWNADDFEQAVIAAASLYFYAARRQMNVNLWTAGTGLLQGHRVVLEALAATHFGEQVSNDSNLPNLPLIWLTQNPDSLNGLPGGSRWVLWTPGGLEEEQKTVVSGKYRGLRIDREQPLEIQLQKQLS